MTAGFAPFVLAPFAPFVLAPFAPFGQAPFGFAPFGLCAVGVCVVEFASLAPILPSPVLLLLQFPRRQSV